MTQGLIWWRWWEREKSQNDSLSHKIGWLGGLWSSPKNRFGEFGKEQQDQDNTKTLPGDPDHYPMNCMARERIIFPSTKSKIPGIGELPSSPGPQWIIDSLSQEKVEASACWCEWNEGFSLLSTLQPFSCGHWMQEDWGLQSNSSL